MKKKIGMIIIGILLILFIAIGIVFGVFKVLESMQNENEKVKQNMEEINVLYQELNEQASSFNVEKEKYDAIMETIYYTNVYEQNSSILTQLNAYDERVGKIIETGNSLQEKCSMTYTDNDIIQKCNSYKISYESAIQVFKSDVQRYNTLVDNYTLWLNENAGYKEIQKFTSKYVK